MSAVRNDALYTASDNRRVFAPLNAANDRRSITQVLEEKTPSSSGISNVYSQQKSGSYQIKSSHSNQTRPQVFALFVFILFLFIFCFPAQLVTGDRCKQ